MLRSTALFLLIFIGSTACSSFQRKLESPKVDLQSVEISKANLQQAQWLFRLNVENPNPVALQVDRIDYLLTLNGQPFIQGLLDQKIHLKAHSSNEIQVPLVIPWTHLARSVSELLQHPVSTYEMQGSVSSGFFRVPFDQKGQIRLSDFF